MRNTSVFQPSTKLYFWLDNTEALTKIFISTVLQARDKVHLRDPVPVGPHQMRKLAASYSATMLNNNRANETMLLERMGYKSMTVIKKCYIAHVPQLSFKCVVPLGTYTP